MRKTTLCTLLFILLLAASAHAQTAAFTYQGKLTDATSAANAVYDFEFALFDAQSGGSPQPQPQPVTLTFSGMNGVPVTNGVFAVSLDFTAAAFPGGAAERYLEIRVKKPSETAFTMLVPRQRLTSAPYAIRTKDSNAADSLSAACAGCVTDGKISSISGAKVTGSVANSDTATTAGNVTGVVAVANGGTGFSTKNFVDLTTAQTVAGAKTFSSAVNTTTQYNIGGARVLSVNIGGVNNLFAGAGAGAVNDGDNNLFVGTNAGNDNTTGGDNSFIGAFAGQNNTQGGANSFFGEAAGLSNTEGFNNSFVGYQAGASNLTGSRNSFFGSNAGLNNATGVNNTAIGDSANVGSNNLNYASAFGSNARVTTSDTIVIGKVAGTYAAVARPADAVQIPGNLTVGGTFTGNVSASGITGVLPTANGGTGLSAPGAAGNYLRSNGTVFTSSAISAADVPNLDAGKVTTGVFSAARLPDLSGTYIRNQTSLQSSSNFNITGSGTAGGTLSANTVNTATNYNIGGIRILSNPGTDNLFVGADAGSGNTTGFSNSFIGSGAGFRNTTGFDNLFVGYFAGNSNTFGRDNSFVGSGAGSINTNGSFNSFVGRNAGAFNGLGSSNSFFGESAGGSNTTGSNNTIIGAGANVSSGSNLSFATALGAGVTVSTSNTVVLGRSQDTVRVSGKLRVDTLGAAGSTPLCHNTISKEISNCGSNLTESNNSALLETLGKQSSQIEQQKTTVQILQTQIERQQREIDRLKQQQKQFDQLKQIVCAIKPDAAVCKETNK